MSKTLALLGLLASLGLSMQANAFVFGDRTISNKNIINQSQYQKAKASAVGTVNGGDINVQDKIQIPNAPSLSAGSSNTTAKWRKFKQRQISSFFGGFTNIDMDLAITEYLEFYLSKSKEERVWYNAAACIESDDWKKLRQQMGHPCPKD